jgi:hypothetical protein
VDLSGDDACGLHARAEAPESNGIRARCKMLVTIVRRFTRRARGVTRDAGCAQSVVGLRCRTPARPTRCANEAPRSVG